MDLLEIGFGDVDWIDLALLRFLPSACFACCPTYKTGSTSTRNVGELTLSRVSGSNVVSNVVAFNLMCLFK
jgi:hypothetical protein